MKTLIVALLLACATTSAWASDPVPLQADALQEFVGSFDLADGRVVTVNRHRQQLFMQINGGPEIAMSAAGPTVFVAPAGTLRLEFEQYSNGSVAGVRLISGKR